MKFSIVVAFKNRDQKRVEFFLDSLQWQLYNDFELIFVNQGSDDEVNEWLEPILLKYPFVNYLFNYTRGHLFNKSNALNIGIREAVGAYIVIADIDIIFPKNFLNSVVSKLDTGIFLTFNAFYLPADIELNRYETVFIEGNSKKCDERFIGLCVATKSSLVAINGYDEYYLLWGAEDDDIIRQLKNTGQIRLHFSAGEMNIYHQWHPNHAPTYPTPWYLDMVNYLYSGDQQQKINKDFGVKVETPKRSVLNRISKNDYFKKIELFPNQLFQFNIFFDDFFTMASGEFGQFEFLDQPPPVIPKGRKQKVIEKVNTVFSKLNFPYAMEKKNIIVQEIFTRERWFEFVTYFIGKHRGLLQDYYLINTDEKLVLYFQKK